MNITLKGCKGKKMEQRVIIFIRKDLKLSLKYTLRITKYA